MTQGSTSHSERDERIGQILSDLHERRARGERVTEDDLLAQYPDLANDLPRYLAVLGELRGAGQDISSLLAGGVLAESDDPEYQAKLGEYKTVEYGSSQKNCNN